MFRFPEYSRHEKKRHLLSFTVLTLGVPRMADIQGAHREARPRRRRAPDAYRSRQWRHPSAQPAEGAAGLSRSRARSLAQAPRYATRAAPEALSDAKRVLCAHGHRRGQARLGRARIEPRAAARAVERGER